MKSIEMLPLSFKNYFKFGGAKHWPGPYLVHYEQEEWPLMFLYSKSDVMIPYLYISHVIDTKRKQNSSRIISSKLFNKSAHVAHLREYPSEYVYELKQFLDKC